MKDEEKINIIPCIMVIISIIVAFTADDNIRKVLLIIVSFLLGIHVQMCIDIMKKR